MSERLNLLTHYEKIYMCLHKHDVFEEDHHHQYDSGNSASGDIASDDSAQHQHQYR